jgi:general secretion pathway protein G
MRIRARSSERGFTLIEMVVVISLILVLLSIALPMYNQSILRAKESTLRQDLFTLRHVIQQYTLDKQKAPQALEDLVAGHYLKFIPKDPMTGRNDTWQVEQEDSIMSPDQTQPGIIDVHSGSNLTASDGSAYSSW